jgi:hypothetical protein
MRVGKANAGGVHCVVKLELGAHVEQLALNTQNDSKQRHKMMMMMMMMVMMMMMMMMMKMMTMKMMMMMMKKKKMMMMMMMMMMMLLLRMTQASSIADTFDSNNIVYSSIITWSACVMFLSGGRASAPLPAYLGLLQMHARLRKAHKYLLRLSNNKLQLYEFCAQHRAGCSSHPHGVHTTSVYCGSQYL